MRVRTGDRTVLVTGGSGALGSQLVRHVVSTGEHVVVLLRGDGVPVRLGDVFSRLAVFRGDITNAADVARCIAESRPKVVFHLASASFNPPPADSRAYVLPIVNGTVNVVEAVRSGAPDAAIVFAGSAAVYPSGRGLSESSPLRPGTTFGAAKAAASLLFSTSCRTNGIRGVELRLFTPYGPWERSGRLIPSLVLASLSGNSPTVTGGDQTRDYVHVDDVIKAFMRAAETSTAPGAVYNICSGRGVPVRQVAEAVMKLLGNSNLRVVPGQARPDEIMEMEGVNDLARRDLGWSPSVGFEEGLRDTVRWYVVNAQIAGQLR